MNQEIELAITNKNDYRVVWHEPYPGLDSANRACFVDVELSTSIDGAIDMIRLHASSKNMEMVDSDALLDFLVIHYATIKKVERPK